MAHIQLTPEAIQSMQAFLEEKGVKSPIRIDIQSTGCCDPSLGLCIDHVNDRDLVLESNELTLIMDPLTLQTVGKVKIDYANEPGKKGFVLTSSIPLSEWEGFGTCEIRLKNKTP
jgi:Fe-S cluster assembly iron-binding protein IscA